MRVGNSSVLKMKEMAKNQLKDALQNSSKLEKLACFRTFIQSRRLDMTVLCTCSNIVVHVF